MNVTQTRDTLDNAVVAELRQLRREFDLHRQEQRDASDALRRLFERFAAVYLDSRFPFGHANDEFARPSVNRWRCR